MITAAVFLLGRYTCGIEKASEKKKLISVSVLVLVSLTLLGILCELQVFRRDDFWEVQYAWDLGLFKFLKYVMETEGGRLFSYLLKGGNAFFPSASASMFYMNTCLFLSLLLLLAGICRLLYLLLKTCGEADQTVDIKKSAFLFAFCLFSAFIFTSPKIWEDWFWDAGGLIFGIGVSLSVMSLALITEDLISGPNQRIKKILTALVLFNACCCNQITTLAIDIFITEVLLFVLCRRGNKRIRLRVLYYFIAALAGSSVCMLAPGNFYRLETNSYYSKPLLSDITGSFGRSIVRLYQQISVNIIMMKKYWLFLVVICLIFGMITKLRNRKKLLFLSAGMIPAGFFSLLINIFIDYMPSRIYISAFIWLAISAALISMIIGSLFRDRLSAVFPGRIRSAYIFLGVLASFFSIFFLYQENHQLLQDIRSAWFYRDAQIRSIPAEKDETREICGVPIIESDWTDIRLAEAFIANYYRLGWVDDIGVCPPFIPVAEDPAKWR